MMFVQQMLIPRDVWELAATVPLPKISKTTSAPNSKTSSPTPRISSPTSPSKTLAASGDPLKSTEPTSLLQQSSALLHKTPPPGQPVSEDTTVEDWIAAAPWVQVSFEPVELLMPNFWTMKQQVQSFRPSLIHPGCRRQEVVEDFQFYFKMIGFCFAASFADGF